MVDRDSPRARILIVDDERGPRESLRMILAPAHEVCTASAGAEALEILRTTDVDVVTLDLNMPGIKGQELMRTVRREHPEVEVIVITGYGTLQTATEGIRYGICDYLQKPFDVVQVSSAVSRALARRRSRQQLLGFLEAVGSVAGRDPEARATLADLQQSLTVGGRLGELLARTADGGSPVRPADPMRALPFVEVLADTIESQDPYSRGHARRVAYYAGLLSERLQLEANEQQQIRLAAFLHDLGKIGVPTALLLRAGALEPSEREAVERHAVIGARLLEPLALDPTIVAAVRHHHEWWDGGGYPDGLHGETIPLAARMIHIADAFDAMSCDRPYRLALSRERVIAELRRSAGIQFDPTLVKEFILLMQTGASEFDPETVANAVASVRSCSESAVPSALRVQNGGA